MFWLWLAIIERFLLFMKLVCLFFHLGVHMFYVPFLWGLNIRPSGCRAQLSEPGLTAWVTGEAIEPRFWYSKDGVPMCPPIRGFSGIKETRRLPPVTVVTQLGIWGDSCLAWLRRAPRVGWRWMEISKTTPVFLTPFYFLKKEPDFKKINESKETPGFDGIYFI